MATGKSSPEELIHNQSIERASSYLLSSGPGVRVPPGALSVSLRKRPFRHPRWHSKIVATENSRPSGARPILYMCPSSTTPESAWPPSKPSKSPRFGQFTTSVITAVAVIVPDVPWTEIWCVPLGVPVYVWSSPPSELQLPISMTRQSRAQATSQRWLNRLERRL